MSEPLAVHVFEKAGLGLAPFRFVGCYTKVGPVEISPGCFAGAPGQPMGTCDYCGQGIAVCYQIQSKDGKQFVVGCDCVYKTGDAGLRRVVDVAARKYKNEMRHKREAERIASGLARLQTPEATAVLASLPHPDARFVGKTLADYFDWMIAHAGNSGKLRAIKEADRALSTSTRKDVPQ